MRRERVDRSATAIPCLTSFTDPLLIGGLPRNLYYLMLGIGVMSVLLFKNLIAGVIVFFIYLILRKINAKDPTTLSGFMNMCKKKYLSY